MEEYDVTRPQGPQRKTWREFQASGLLWWINRTLHLFGWAIVLEMHNDEVTGAYPAKVAYRGFGRESEEKGFLRVTKYLRRNAGEMLRDLCEDADIVMDGENSDDHK